MKFDMGFYKVKTNKKEMIIDLFFPNKCPFCDKAIHWTKYCCDKCYDNSDIEHNTEYRCSRCDRLLSKCICDKLEIPDDIYYDRIYYSGKYTNDLVRKAVLSLKYNKDGNAYELFSDSLSRGIIRDRDLNIISYDYIVPVPMNIRKERIRGYNQSECLANAISEKISVPVNNNLIMKVYSDKSQHERDTSDRIISARNEYKKIEGAYVKGNLLLCDDIMTSGATLNNCARLLKELGADSVSLVVCVRKAKESE